LVAAGYFGLQYYVQQRLAGAVETAFEQFRATGGKASHGRIAFNLFQRAIAVSDVAMESASQPPFSLTITRLSASGLGLRDPTRFSAAQIDASDVTATASVSGQALHLAAPHLLAAD
jgi:hypothetical protein